MRRALAVVALAALVALLHAPEVRAGAGQAGLGLAGKISGPAVSAVIVMDVTVGSPTFGQTTIRVQKGSAFAGAVFDNQQAVTVPWVLGCDSVHGVKPGPYDLTNPEPDGLGDFTATTLTDLRFLNKPLGNWIPSVDAQNKAIPGSVLHSLLFGDVEDGGLELTPNNLIPGITDIDNAVCTQVVDGGFTKYILSFSALIQHAETVANE